MTLFHPYIFKVRYKLYKQQTQTKPIYFHSDLNTVTKFDELVKYRRSNRSSILNYLMEMWTDSEIQKINRNGKSNHFERDKQLINKMKQLKNDMKHHNHQPNSLFDNGTDWLMDLGR